MSDATETKFRIVFAIYPGMTHLDFTGPHQFLSRLPNSETIVASPDGGDVPADGLTFGNTVKIADVRSCDLICVPGGDQRDEGGTGSDVHGRDPAAGIGRKIHNVGLHWFADPRGGWAADGQAGGLPLGLCGAAAGVWRDP